MRAYIRVIDSEQIATFRPDGAKVTQANVWNPGGAKSIRDLEHGELFLSQTNTAHGYRTMGAAGLDPLVVV